MTDIAIRVENLSKRYRIGQYVGSGAQYKTLRESLTNAVSAPLRRLRQTGDRRRKTDLRSPVSGPLSSGSSLRSPVSGQPSSDGFLWALKDVSFEIKRGEVVGIIGRNGAGKSTLLKILTGITEPTEGRAELKGRVNSLLEVGTGFHPELTGRENVRLSGAILGMARKEIDRKFDEIVDFSGVETYIDTPVKRYSSGMRVRLGFAVAAHLEPEILLIDEVLAVGDVAFQQKCLGKMEKVAGEGRTVLFVSHNMGSIGRLCQTAMLLEQGRLVCSGDVSRVIARYLQEVIDHEAELFFPLDETKTTMQIRAIRILDHTGRPASTLDRSLPFRLEIRYDVHQHVVGAYVLFNLNAADGTRIWQSFDTDMTPEGNIAREPGSYIATVEVPGGLLNLGTYRASIALARQPGYIVYDFHPLSFSLEDCGTFAAAATRPQPIGVLAIPLKWTTEICE